jgi:hypothetical protein
MDAKPRDTSMRLVLASVPVQALIMVATFGFLIGGGASTSHVQPAQFGPGTGTSRIVMVPVEACQAGGQPDGSAVPSPDALACPNGDFFFSQDPWGNVTYVVMPCCGG